MKNPVMFVVEIGAFLTLFYLVQSILGKSESQVSTGYLWHSIFGCFLPSCLLILRPLSPRNAAKLKLIRSEKLAVTPWPIA